MLLEKMQPFVLLCAESVLPVDGFFMASLQVRLQTSLVPLEHFQSLHVLNTVVRKQPTLSLPSLLADVAATSLAFSVIRIPSTAASSSGRFSCRKTAFNSLKAFFSSTLIEVFFREGRPHLSRRAVKTLCRAPSASRI